MRQEELSHVKEAKGKRVKGRREDKVSPRMVGAGGEWSIAHVELGDNTCLKFIKSHLIGLGWVTDWVAAWWGGGDTLWHYSQSHYR